ncbi:phytochrome A type 3-like [Castanea sativa]|uniref:phytochrome A type 3-like n=1 Tax=Castanea sativa TaxID=21020 RepID=UPI003F653ADD
MHPRSSFKAFLEIVKQCSRPWEDVEMDAILSLQLVLRVSFQDEIVDESKIIVNVPLETDLYIRTSMCMLFRSEYLTWVWSESVCWLFTYALMPEDQDAFYQMDSINETLLSANKRTDANGSITGVLFFLHVASPDLQYALQVQRISEQAEADSIKKLSYFGQETSKPLWDYVYAESNDIF